MKQYDMNHIRNLSLIGHGDSGKTSLTSAVLFSSGMVNRLGRVEEGNTVTDFDDDEIERTISINASLCFAAVSTECGPKASFMPRVFAAWPVILR